MKVPYFSQWESRGLTLDVLEHGAAALARDPNWAASGAATIDEYVTWADQVCGMACLKMILAARGGRARPILELARACTAYGGYTVSEAGDIKGLIYAPFVEFVRREFGLEAEVVVDIRTGDIAEVMRRARYFIASVHPGIRWPERAPPSKGGHLVLVLEADADAIVFHNPSGHDVATQEYVRLPPADFDRFFAGRGVAVYP
ncbi:hypothetical protein [Desertibaculum subflavum]|uniref:hypothetical protein n=1 Tax=Desertibaculum subflavum TaxID=2268458 RepID=UPI000E674EDE